MILLERIKQRRQQLGMRQVDLAKAVNVSQSTMSDYETGRYEPDLDTLAKIAAELKVTVGWLMSEKTYNINHPDDSFEYESLMRAVNKNYVTDQLENFLFTNQIVTAPAFKIPVLGDVAAGIPIEAITDIVDYEELPISMASTGEYFGLRIKGASMEPRMREGDVVIVRKQDDVESGDVAVVMVNGDSATVKKIKKGPSGITLIPNNPVFDTMFYTNDEIQSLPVRILGKVVELRAKF